MPPLSYDEASLDEILEVRLYHLNEDETWAVLFGGITILKSVLVKEKIEKLMHLASILRPDTIVLCLDGTMKFAITKNVGRDKTFIAPEYLELSMKRHDTRLKSRIEKMLIYSLGMIAKFVTEYGTFESMNLSNSIELEALIGNMINGDYSLRIECATLLKKVMQFIDMNSCKSIITRLAEEIVGPFGLAPLQTFASLLHLPEPLAPVDHNEYDFITPLIKMNQISNMDHTKAEGIDSLIPLENSKAKAIGFKDSLEAHSANPLSYDLGKGSIRSFTSHYSSQVSLTHGDYVLDADKGDWVNEMELKRYHSEQSLSNRSDSIASKESDLHTDNFQGNGKNGLEFIGPEFVRISSDPEKAFIDICQPRFGPMPKGRRTAFVILPNSQRIQTNVQVTSKGKDLFHQIATHLGLKETLYFGLTLIKDDEHIFIDLESKLTKYSPTGWKDENPKKRKSDFILFFRVKFYVEELSTLKHNLTLHLYYVQMRQDILQGLMHCPDSYCVMLAGYALQAEYGTNTARSYRSQYFNPEHYVPKKLLSCANQIDIVENLSQLHQNNMNISPRNAEVKFLEEAKVLPEYGVLFYKVSRSKKINTDIVWLGICINGIVILEPKGHQRVAVHKQAWHLIKEFFFEKKKFIINPKNLDEYPKMVFFTNHYRRSKYLFRMCQSFHRFQMFSQTHSRTQQISKDTARLERQTMTLVDNPDPMSNSVLLSENQYTVQFKKMENEKLGITIVGGEDSNRLKLGIFVQAIEPDSLTAKDGRISEGDRILLVNGKNLESATHEEAVQALKNVHEKVVLVLTKSTANASIMDKSGLSPSLNHSKLKHEHQNEWQINKPMNKEDIKAKLKGINIVKDFTSEERGHGEKYVDVEGRQSQEGNRILKELLKNITFKDDGNEDNNSSIKLDTEESNTDNEIDGDIT